jgi:hypothetical protein
MQIGNNKIQGDEDRLRELGRMLVRLGSMRYTRPDSWHSTS